MTLANTYQEVLQTDGRVYVQWCDEPSHFLTNLVVWARDDNGNQVCDVQRGDSGAPFYFEWYTSPPQLSIRGIVSSYDTGTHVCYGVQYGTIQSKTGYHVYAY